MNRELEPEEIEFIKRINEVFLCKEKRNFEDVLRDYRRIEEETLERDDEYRHLRDAYADTLPEAQRDGARRSTYLAHGDSRPFVTKLRAQPDPAPSAPQ